MSFINWSDDLFYISLVTGESVPEGTPGAIGFWTYGNYGGAGYAAGEFGGELPAKPNGKAYNEHQLLKAGDANQDPVDGLDFIFYQHDFASAQAGSGYTEAQAAADLALIKSLIKFDPGTDAEASFYAGVTTIAMLGSLAIHSELDLLSPRLLAKAVEDAAGDIRYGLENLPPAELANLLTLFTPTLDPFVFTLDFALITSTPAQEADELLAMSALNLALDAGEIDDVPLDTGFPVPGTTDYQLALNVMTHDLDLLSF
jgi:hypothetical protein